MIAERRSQFGDDEKETFRPLLHKLLEFSGLEAMTWCCMGNLLLKVPQGDSARAAMTEDELFTRLKGALSEAFIRETKCRIGHTRKLGNDTLADQIIDGLI